MVKHDDIRETLKRCDAILVSTPDDWSALSGRCQALLALGRLGEAEQGFSDLIERDIGRPDGYEGLAQVSMRRRRFVQALDRWQTCLRQIPDHQPALLGRCYALLELGRLVEAESGFKGLLDRKIGLPSSYEGLIRCLFVAEKFEEANDVYFEAIERFPDDVLLRVLGIKIGLNLESSVDTGQKRLRDAFRAVGAHPLLKVQEMILGFLVDNELVPWIDDFIQSLIDAGQIELLLEVSYRLILAGFPEKAREIIDEVSAISDSAESVANARTQLAMIGIFFDGDMQRGLRQLAGIDADWKLRNGVVFPGTAYRPTSEGMPPATRGRLLVLIHVFHPDLLGELLDATDRLPKSMCDFWFSVSEKAPNRDDLVERITEKVPHANLVITDNRGFDIGGYWRVLREVDLDRYALAMFMHTKKGEHSMAAGTRWRRHLLDALVCSKATVEDNINLMLTDSKLLLIGSLLVAPLAWRETRPGAKYHELLRAGGLDFDLGSQFFVPGTMFMARASYIKNVYERFSDLEFEDPDELSFMQRFDGSYAHAVERLFGAFARHEGVEAYYRQDPARLLLRRV